MPEGTESKAHNNFKNHHFSGNVYIFQAYDVGDDINLEKVQKIRALGLVPLSLPKYFKNYHTPLAVDLPHPHESTRFIGSKIHNFGAISLTYQVPFSGTLSDLRKQLVTMHNQYQEQSVMDVKSIFKTIERCITKPIFFQMNTSYTVVQVTPDSSIGDIAQLKRDYGAIIASMLRFETQDLSEPQKNDILEGDIGYFRGDLIIIDTDAAFLYDAEYREILDFFEFANIQQLELRYFDRLLDQQLNKMYEGEGRNLPLISYLPFATSVEGDPMSRLSKMRVDISVIAERLEGSVKLAGEPYYSELYQLLKDKLDLKNWQQGIDRKLSIIHDIQSTYQNKIDVTREDLLSVLIILLIFIELVIGLLNFFVK